MEITLPLKSLFVPKIKAMFLMLASSLFFALMGALVKTAGNVPFIEKALFRNLVSLFLALFLVIYRKQNPWGKRGNRMLLLARGVSGTIGMVLYFYGIDRLILADSSMLNKMNPFFVTIFAVIILKERITRHQVASLILALLGAALIIKPSFGFSQAGPAAVCFLSAVFAGLAYTFVSLLAGREDGPTIVFYFSLVSTLVCLPLSLIHFVVPTLTQLLLLIGAGVVAALGQFSLTVAYRYAPASEVSIYNYSNVVFSSLLGIFLFSEVPDLASLSGYCLIVGAGYIIYKFGSSRAAD